MSDAGVSLVTEGTRVTHDRELDLWEIFSDVSLSARGAVLSADETCRFLLWRNWAKGRRRLCTFIGLNPSTADANKDDPTIRRCVDFAKRWNCTGLRMVNLFATRSTDPSGIRVYHELVANEMYVNSACVRSDVTVAAWGSHNLARASVWASNRHRFSLECLGVNKDGSPKHPLYVPATRPLVTWDGYL